MTHMRNKLIIAGILLMAAVSYLAYAGLKDGWVYHMDVDKYLSTQEPSGQRVRLVGKVAEEGLDSQPAKLLANFTLKGESGSLPVQYRGAVPELFKADVEVIVEGSKDSAGTFHADVMLTKCASKYQSEEHAKRNKEM